MSYFLIDKECQILTSLLHYFCTQSIMCLHNEFNIGGLYHFLELSGFLENYKISLQKTSQFFR